MRKQKNKTKKAGQEDKKEAQPNLLSKQTKTKICIYFATQKYR